VAQNYINKEMCTVYVVFTLFCPTLLYISMKAEGIGKVMLYAKCTLISTLEKEDASAI
jgi:hypothetical protein